MKSTEAKASSPALPLPNKRRELFCVLYSEQFWGRPAEAILAAKFKPRPGGAEKAALKLLEEPDVKARVKHLREIRSENSVADPAWIKDHFVEIVQKAEKDSDRIRALTGLQKAIQGPPQQRRREQEDSLVQPQLPLFEGGDDGAS